MQNESRPSEAVVYNQVPSPPSAQAKKQPEVTCSYLYDGSGDGSGLIAELRRRAVVHQDLHHLRLAARGGPGDQAVTRRREERQEARDAQPVLAPGPLLGEVLRGCGGARYFLRQHLEAVGLLFCSAVCAA